MARDYLAISATTCMAERSFSLSKRTDNPLHRTMKEKKFGGLQKLRAGYLDGRIDPDSAILKKYMGDFVYKSDSDSD